MIRLIIPIFVFLFLAFILREIGKRREIDKRISFLEAIASGADRFIKMIINLFFIVVAIYVLSLLFNSSDNTNPKKLLYESPQNEN